MFIHDGYDEEDDENENNDDIRMHD